MAEKKITTLCAVGDVVAFYSNPESAFEHVGEILRGADITFAQNERHYSGKRTREDMSTQVGFTEMNTPQNAEALKLGGFDVISFASNHSMDIGPETMLETVHVLKNLGFAVIGAGKNIAEARKSAIVERNGARIAFLAYASVLRPGNNAGPSSAGCAPLRAWTHYHQIDYQPATPPQILSFAYKDDLEALIADVKKAKSQADLVVFSCHWGVHFAHGVIAMYQQEIAHAAIDAGVDIILGHHPHILHGIEVYKGKPIFYSMGNFAFDCPGWIYDEARKRSPEAAARFDRYGFKPDPEWDEFYALPPECRKSMIVKCTITKKKLERVSFLPVLINQKAQPRPVSSEDVNFDDQLRYMQEITESAGLKTKFSVEASEIVISLT